MNGEVAWVLELQIADGRVNDLRALIDEMVAGTRAEEPGALVYEWNLSADGTSCHIYERYANSDATMVHLSNFMAKYAPRFLELLRPTRFTVYGSPSAPLREALGMMGPVFMEPAGGFRR